MSKKVIRLGDHGGQVIATSATHFTVNGGAVAFKGKGADCQGCLTHPSLNPLGHTSTPHETHPHP